MPFLGVKKWSLQLLSQIYEYHHDKWIVMNKSAYITELMLYSAPTR
jgi:hypothetical protein